MGKIHEHTNHIGLARVAPVEVAQPFVRSIPLAATKERLGRHQPAIELARNQGSSLLGRATASFLLGHGLSLASCASLSKRVYSFLHGEQHGLTRTPVFVYIIPELVY